MVSRPRFRHKTMLVTGGPGFKLRSVFKQKILSKYLYFNLIMPKGKNKTLSRKSPLASQSFLSEYKALTLKPETRLSRLLSPAYYRVLDRQFSLECVRILIVGISVKALLIQGLNPTEFCSAFLRFHELTWEPYNLIPWSSFPS